MLQHVLNLGKEAHVEHPIHFIEDQNTDLGKPHGSLLEMIIEPAGSSDDVIGPRAQLVRLSAKRLTSHHERPF